MKYWAFVSYSHRDAPIAARLQRFIETYAIPKALVASSNGRIPAHLKPVFRDRDELQAGSDLNSTVRAALADSRFLVVVCSPDAARSQWANREILEFKKIHGEANVLAFIAAGEPFASRMPGREGEECFPEALRFALTPDGEPRGEALEPIAADMRPHADGPRLAMLKIVAGMIGVGLNELVQRDEQRRMRRMAAIVAGSMAGMAVMAVLTLMAVHARNEAQSQRAQAEDLLEFMLGDLREKLVPVGRLDVLDAVGAKALSYYARQDPSSLDANELGTRSRAMHLIGEMRVQRGQLAEALEAFQSAARTTAELLQRSPRDGQRLFDHAQSTYWVGYIAWRRGQAEEAASSFAEYRRLAGELATLDPGNVDWQLEPAYADTNLGVVQLARGDLDGALRSFSSAREIYERLIPRRNAVAKDLAEALSSIAKVHEAKGDYEAAIASETQRLGVIRSMPDAGKDRRIQQQVANAMANLARLALLQGRPRDAQRYLTDALGAIRELAGSDPANMAWLSELCFYRLRFAEIARALGDLPWAHAMIAETGPDVTRLKAKDSTSLRWNVQLDAVYLTEITLLAFVEGTQPPTANLEQLVDRARAFEAQGKKLGGLPSESLAEAQLLLGDALARSGRDAEAREQWGASLARAASGEREGMAVIRARALVRLDRVEEAKALLARLEASRYRHPAYAELSNELGRDAAPRLTKTQRRQ